jgi:hypothetical protein
MGDELPSYISGGAVPNDEPGWVAVPVAVAVEP